MTRLTFATSVPLFPHHYKPTTNESWLRSSGEHAATYIFASLAAAKYLAESIEAQISWINHVPHNMLVGPAIPLNKRSSHTSRYTTGMFEFPRPHLLRRTSEVTIIKRILNKENTPLSHPSIRELFMPLPSTRQRKGYHIGFFEQGFLTGGLLLTSVATVMAAYGIWTFKTRGLGL